MEEQVVGGHLVRLFERDPQRCRCLLELRHISGFRFRRLKGLGFRESGFEGWTRVIPSGVAASWNSATSLGFGFRSLSFEIWGSGFRQA